MFEGIWLQAIVNSILLFCALAGLMGFVLWLMAHTEPEPMIWPEDWPEDWEVLIWDDIERES